MVALSKENGGRGVYKFQVRPLRGSFCAGPLSHGEEARQRCCRDMGKALSGEGQGAGCVSAAVLDPPGKTSQPPAENHQATPVAAT